MVKIIKSFIKITSIILLAIIYFGIITPISLLLRLFGKDILDQKLRNQSSYWIDRKKKIGKMDNQF